METSPSQLGYELWEQICAQVFKLAVFLTITMFAQQPLPPVLVLPLQAAAAAM